MGTSCFDSRQAPRTGRRQAARVARLGPQNSLAKRRDRDPIAFGHGSHRCLAATLARLEAHVAFQTLFERCRNLRLERNEIQMLGALPLRGPKRLSIGFEAV